MLGMGSLDESCQACSHGARSPSYPRAPWWAHPVLQRDCRFQLGTCSRSLLGAMQFVQIRMRDGLSQPMKTCQLGRLAWLSLQRSWRQVFLEGFCRGMSAILKLFQFMSQEGMRQVGHGWSMLKATMHAYSSTLKKHVCMGR